MQVFWKMGGKIWNSKHMVPCTLDIGCPCFITSLPISIQLLVCTAHGQYSDFIHKPFSVFLVVEGLKPWTIGSESLIRTAPYHTQGLPLKGSFTSLMMQVWKHFSLVSCVCLSMHAGEKVLEMYSWISAIINTALYTLLLHTLLFSLKDGLHQK